MAKAKGGVRGASESRLAQGGIPRSWLATTASKDGGYFVGPDGQVYDVDKIYGATHGTNHYEAAPMLAEKLGWDPDGDEDPEFHLWRNGWGSIRNWRLGGGRDVVGFRIAAGGNAALRQAQRLMDWLGDHGQPAYDKQIDIAWDWYDEPAGYAHEVQVDAAELMSASSWRDIGG